jgi:WD40 repeat protein
MKEKTLLRIDRDRLAKQAPTAESADAGNTSHRPPESKVPHTPTWSRWPKQGPAFQPVWTDSTRRMEIMRSISCPDSAPISRLISKHDVIVSCGDDGYVRKISSVDLSVSEIIGRHTAFASGSAWINSDKMLTSAGDGEIKIWDIHTFESERWSFHHSCVWSLDVLGHYALTGCMDHTAKLIDINRGKCRHTLRVHVDSINRAVFLDQTSALTASADKSVSLWDIRTSNCISTSFVHRSVVSDVAACAHLVISSDLAGHVAVSDIRRGLSLPLKTYQLGHGSVNCVLWLGRDSFLAGCKDGSVVQLFSDERSIDRLEMSQQGPILSMTRVESEIITSSSKELTTWS